MQGDSRSKRQVAHGLSAFDPEMIHSWVQVTREKEGEVAKRIRIRE